MNVLHAVMSAMVNSNHIFREILMESVTACRASLSIQEVKILITPGEGTPATRRRRDFRYFIRQLDHIV
jgi:hypothetical protein